MNNLTPSEICTRLSESISRNNFEEAKAMFNKIIEESINIQMIPNEPLLPPKKELITNKKKDTEIGKKQKDSESSSKNKKKMRKKSSSDSDQQFKKRQDYDYSSIKEK